MVSDEQILFIKRIHTAKLSSVLNPLLRRPMTHGYFHFSKIYFSFDKKTHNFDTVNGGNSTSKLLDKRINLVEENFKSNIDGMTAINFKKVENMNEQSDEI